MEDDKGSHERVMKRPITDEMREDYIDYAMSVIIGRALPDVRDGLKPVHRRILYAMQELGLIHSRPHKKCARIVGTVLGIYHPHGDQAVYDALVRMAQWFSLRYLLVDGQGNFGSIDGDSAAAMRYTEARLSKAAEEMLVDIEKNTVNFVPNFDGSAEEPEVLPSRLPNLLINGSSGIAVGMSTNMPPHNIAEVCDAVVMLVENPDAPVEQLMTVIKGPDFPTGGIICGRSGIFHAYKTGRGTVTVRARVDIENEDTIAITEIPYMVNKSMLIEHIADLVKNKQVEGIRNLRDESDKEGMRIVVELHRDASPELVLNKLYEHTEMQSTFGIINLALVGNRPMVLPLRDILLRFIEHRKDVIIRRTKFLLEKAKERAHILEGLQKALANIDRVVHIIKKSENPPAAKAALMSEFGLSDKQTDAILQMRLQTLTGLEQHKIIEEHAGLVKDIERYEKILGSDAEVMGIIRQETLEIRENYADARKTVISGEELGEMCDEDLVPKEDVVVTMTNKGYVKRVPVVEYRMQRRGGKGITATGIGEDGFVKEMFIANSHDYLLLFSNKGRVHWLRTFQLPAGSRYSMGKAIVNYIQLEEGEKISTVMPVKGFGEGKYLIFCTKKGQAKKTAMVAYSRPRKGGIIAVSLREGDELIDVEVTDGNRKVFLATRKGYSIKFDEKDVRVMGRSASGVRGIRLRHGDEVIGMEMLDEGEQILTVSDNGYGKRTESSYYKVQRRGGKGIKNMKITAKNGLVKAIKKVTGAGGEQLMLITTKGTAIRVATSGISLIGRSTQGVRVMRLEEGDRLEDIALLEEQEDAVGSPKEGGDIFVSEDGEGITETAGEAVQGSSEEQTEETGEGTAGDEEEFMEERGGEGSESEEKTRETADPDSQL